MLAPCYGMPGLVARPEAGVSGGFIPMARQFSLRGMLMVLVPTRLAETGVRRQCAHHRRIGRRESWRRVAGGVWNFSEP